MVSLARIEIIAISEWPEIEKSKCSSNDLLLIETPATESDDLMQMKMRKMEIYGEAVRGSFNIQPDLIILQWSGSGELY